MVHTSALIILILTHCLQQPYAFRH